MDKRSDVEDFQHPLRSLLLALPVTERLQTMQHRMVKLLGDASSHIMGKGETIP
jgi:hypothetical protein